MKRIRTMVVLLVCLVISAGYALAKDHGREWREHERREAFRRDMRDRRAHWQHEREYRREADRRRIERERWERARWQREHRYRGDDHRPAGWDRGRKTGWGDRDVPPGQAKKMGYFHRDYDGRHNDWQRTPGGLYQTAWRRH